MMWRRTRKTSKFGDVYQPAPAVLRIIKEDFMHFVPKTDVKRKRISDHSNSAEKRRKITSNISVGERVRVFKGLQPLPRQLMFEEFIGMIGTVKELFPGFCSLEVMVHTELIHIRAPIFWVKKL